MNLTNKNMVVLHHSLTTDSDTVSWKAIEKYHKEVNGWKDIGYHFGVEVINGEAYALVGRPEDKDAAAVKEGMTNRHGIHVCIVGNFDKVEPTQAVLDCLVDRILIPVMRRWSIPGNAIRLHREFNATKSCPGKKFPLAKVLQMVGARWTQ